MVALACAGAAGATLGGASPTGVGLVDLIYVGLAGAALALAGGRSGRVPWLVGGVIALWLTPTTVGRIAAIAAVGLGVYAARTGRRRALGAGIGALLAFVLGDLGAGSFQGATALGALVAAAPILGSGVRRMPLERRRTAAAAASVGAATAAVATLLFGLSALLAIGDVGDGVRAADRGFDFVGDGDQTGAANAFDAAADAFERARGKVSGFWALPARLVPVVGQHARAVQVVAAEGVALSQTASDTARSVDPDDVRLIDGGLDLSVVQDLEPILDRAERALTRAHTRVDDARNPWLLSPIDTRVSDLLAELADAAPSAHTAALAAREVPTMLGVDGPVHWLVAITTPAEARGLGGLVANWALVEADHGRIEVVLTGRNEDINAVLRARDVTLTGPEQYLARWGPFSPEEFFQDVTLSPDLPMVAEVTAGLFEQATDLDVDGVLFLDPYAIAAVLDLTGPITTPDRRLTDSTVVPFLLEEQYVEYADDEDGRVAALHDLVLGAFDAVTTGALPGPRAVADRLGPMVTQDRLGLWWQAGGGPEDLIADAGLDGRFPDAGDGDLLGLVHQNAGQNKLDAHLRRELDYHLRITDGEAEATITVTLHNDLDDLSLPPAIVGSNDQGYPPGTNVVRLTVHTALDLQGAVLDGEPFLVSRETAFGHDAVTALIEVPPGATRVLEVSVRATTALTDETYHLTLPHQPLVNDDIVRLDVEVDGVAVVGGPPFALTSDDRVGPGT